MLKILLSDKPKRDVDKPIVAKTEILTSELKNSSNASKQQPTNINLLSDTNAPLQSTSLDSNKVMFSINQKFSPLSSNSPNIPTTNQSNSINENIIKPSMHKGENFLVINPNKSVSPSSYDPKKENKKKALNSSNSLISAKSSYTDRLQTLQSFISAIKTNDNGNSIQLNNKMRKRDQLKNSVDILNANLRGVRREKKLNSKLKKETDIENERMKTYGEKAIEESFFIQKDIPLLREEIFQMGEDITQLNEESKQYRNEYIEVERELLTIKDEIQKKNSMISSIKREKEKLRVQILEIKKHNEMLDNKIKRIEAGSDEFMNSVGLLVQKSFSGKQ